MRPIWSGLVVTLLSACSSTTAPMRSLPLPIPMPNEIKIPNVSGESVPYPSDYERRVAEQLLAQGESAEVSPPQAHEPWSITDPIGWYVCVKQAHRASPSVIILDSDRITGYLAIAPASYCGPDTQYFVIERQ
jgi:hypothetical protein